MGNSESSQESKDVNTSVDLEQTMKLISCNVKSDEATGDTVKIDCFKDILAITLLRCTTNVDNQKDFDNCVLKSAIKYEKCVQNSEKK